MAEVFLSQSEISQIQERFDRGPNSEGNYSDLYGLIVEILRAHEGGEDIKNWFAGAQQANGNDGVYSTLIREYSQRQMQLRGIGEEYSDALMQRASNAVAVSAVSDILNDARKLPDGRWRFVTIDEVAEKDATEVGAVLFASLTANDSALVTNSGWSGTALFAGLNSDQSGRLLMNAGSSGLDRLEDMKNVLFAYDALQYGIKRNMQAVIDNAMNFNVDMRQFLTDIVIGFNTWMASGTREVYAIMAARLTLILPDSAQEIGKVIEAAGTSTVLDWIAATLKGEMVSEKSNDIGSRAPAVFDETGLAEQVSWKVYLLSEAPKKIAELGETDIAVRNALLALSPIVIEKPSYKGDTSLYDPESGKGALSKEWLADRADFLTWDKLYRLDKQSDGVVQVGAGLPVPIPGDIRYMDLQTSYQLKIDGLDAGVIPLKMIYFGSDIIDAFAGGKGDDRLYGGAGGDFINGGEGDDYIEGNAGDDLLDGGKEGADCLVGGAGADTLIGHGGDTLLGGQEWIFTGYRYTAVSAVFPLLMMQMGWEKYMRPLITGTGHRCQALTSTHYGSTLMKHWIYSGRGGTP
ncbi:calcium-binding protein [Massilia sp. YMA4]|uniref:calcium-binding protein n=1 Tax=Massilia sp. YMA4 TaxID=1593482 RepID=UPI001D0C731A|nr:calcium-binding protein [Massilia sp. YMA4]